MHIQWLDIIIRFMCISPIQRPHYIPSSYTYQFFEKSYFIIVLHKISCSRQFESELSLHSLASLFPIKEGSTSHLGLLQWSLHPLRFPRSRGTETSGEKKETALLGARNRYAIRLTGHQSPRQIVRDGTAWV